MSSDWIRRVFNRPLISKKTLVKKSYSKPISTDDSEVNSEKTIVNNELSVDQTSLFAENLESDFLNWILNCPVSLEITDSHSIRKKELNDKKYKLLTLIDHEMQGAILIPRRPASLPMLIKLLNDENSSHTQMSKILLSDPALTSQILKTANSPYFRSSSDDVETIEQAVLILGRQGIRNIISTTIMMPMLKGEGSKEGPFSKRAWQWALLSASACCLYAQVKDQDPGPLYLLGLLPSLAYLVVYRTLLRYEKTHPELGEIEPILIKSLLRSRSWKLCHVICEQWGLPKNCETYLLDAEKLSLDAVFAPLRDGMVLGMHKILQRESTSPFNDNQLFSITCASTPTNNKVIEIMGKE